MADVHRVGPVVRQPDSGVRLTAWPPNWLLSAETAFIVGDCSCREAKRANSEAAITGVGTR